MLPAELWPQHAGSGVDRVEPDERQAINWAAERLAGGDAALVEGLLTAHGLAPPTVRWDPGPADLPRAPLPFLLDYWRERRGPFGMPPVEMVDPFALRPALGYLLLLDVIEDGWDFRYRLYGSEIARHSKRDYTGLRTSDIAFTGVSRFYLACYRAVLMRPVPLFTENAAPASVSVASWHRLILPLADDAGRVIRFLVGNIPGPWRQGTEDR
jgi:hypothetical protein